MRKKPERWLEMFHCSHGHFHVIWYRNGRHEHVTLSLEKLANMLLDHGEIGELPATVTIGVIEARSGPRTHPKDLN